MSSSGSEGSALGFVFEWETGTAESSSEATTGWLTITIERTTVWDRARWTWVALLEHLCWMWPALELQSWPAARVDASSPDRLEAEASHARHRDEALSDRIWEFIESHDLAAGIRGAEVAPLRVVRLSTNEAVVSGAGVVVRLSWAEVRGWLTELGEQIVARLSACADARALSAIRDWTRRDDLDGHEALQLYLAAEEDDIDAVMAAAAPYAGGEPMPGRSPILAAARGALGYLEADDWSSLFEVVSQAARHTHHESLALVRLRKSVLAQVNDAPGAARDYELGYARAAALRGVLGNADRRLDVAGLLTRLGVPVTEVELSCESFDALCVWSPTNDGEILLNTAGAHNRSTVGRRATLAHELCHVLFDRGTAFEFVEIKGGNAPRHVERRAGAFAAELLVPGAVVRTVAVANPSLEAFKKAFGRLVKRMGVSRQLAAHQFENHAELPPRIRSWVERVAYGVRGL